MIIKLVPPEKGSDCGHYACMENFDYNTLLETIGKVKRGVLVYGRELIRGGAELPLRFSRYKYMIGTYTVVEP